MLLEVVLALTLFVIAATVITSALNASLREVDRLKLNLHASDLAITVLSEIQMGQLALESAGPQPFEAPYTNWNWEVRISPFGDTVISPLTLQRLEIIVRHESEPVVRRLTQVVPLLNRAAATPSPDQAPPQLPGATAAGPEGNRVP